MLCKVQKFPWFFVRYFNAIKMALLAGVQWLDGQRCSTWKFRMKCVLLVALFSVESFLQLPESGETFTVEGSCSAVLCFHLWHWST